MKIYVDADACPTAIKDIILRAAERLKILTVFVANKPVRLPRSALISMIIVAGGPDIADDAIVEMASSGDLIITADIPLADRVISGGGFVITPGGDLLTAENIKERLTVRDLLSGLRDAGIETGGPPPLSQKLIRNFANQLDRFLTKHI